MNENNSIFETDYLQRAMGIPISRERKIETRGENEAGSSQLHQLTR
jgi:hypothetical protein